MYHRLSSNNIDYVQQTVHYGTGTFRAQDLSFLGTKGLGYICNSSLSYCSTSNKMSTCVVCKENVSGHQHALECDAWVHRKCQKRRLNSRYIVSSCFSYEVQEL